MQDIAAPILVIVITLMENPYVPLLLTCPFSFSVSLECIFKKFSVSDTIISSLAVFLLFSGLFFFLLGLGLTSPLFTSNVSSSSSINTKIVLNNQNLSLLNTTENVQFFNGFNNSNFSIINISTTVEPSKAALDFGTLGLIIGIVSLGVSIILSAISTILTIYKSYETSSLTNEEYRKISIVWIIFGFVVLCYGYSLSGLISALVKLFGILYLDLGLLSFIIFSLFIHMKQSFSQKIESAIVQIKMANQDQNESRFSWDGFRDNLNTFINNKKSMESPPIRAWVVVILSLVIIGYGFWSIQNPNSFLNYLPQVITLGIGLGAFVWAVTTLYYYHNRLPTPEVSPQPRTE
jgi:hypothetical protein